MFKHRFVGGPLDGQDSAIPVDYQEGTILKVDVDPSTVADYERVGEAWWWLRTRDSEEETLRRKAAGIEEESHEGQRLFFGGPCDGDWMHVGGYSSAQTLVVEWPQDGNPMTEEIYRLYRPTGMHEGESWRLHIESRPALRLRVKQR